MVRKLFTAGCLMSLMSGCASVSQVPQLSLSPRQVSLAEQTCMRVMGLKPGEAYFIGCRNALSNALSEQNQSHAMAAAYVDCSHKGLAEGSADFSTCMLEGSQFAATPSQSLAVAYASRDDPQAGRSFYDVTPTTRWNRQRMSCAQLGLTPGTPAFADCIASLIGAF